VVALPHFFCRCENRHSEWKSVSKIIFSANMKKIF
jgi:hypothetical protein